MTGEWRDLPPTHKQLKYIINTINKKLTETPLTRKKPMYKYYQEVEYEHHYPYAREVAEELYKYGLATEDKKPALRLVTAYLNQTDRELNGPTKLYYNSRNGLRRVYVTGIELLNLAHTGKAFFQKEGQYEPDHIHTVTIGNKNYRYTILKEDHEPHA